MEPGMTVVATKTQISSYLQAHSAEVTGTHETIPTSLYGFWRFELRSSCELTKCSCLLSHLPGTLKHYIIYIF